jgi:hypothetical protein
VNEFIEECRREWRRLGVPDPIANEMAADLVADIEEAESEGGTAEDVLGKRVRPSAVRRVMSGRERRHRTAGAPSLAPPVARPGLWSDGVHGPAGLGRRRLTGGSPRCRCHFFGWPEGVHAQIGPCVPGPSVRGAAHLARRRHRTVCLTFAGRWCGRYRSHRLVLVALERQPDRTLGDPPTPCSLWRSEEVGVNPLTTLPKSFLGCPL